MSASVLNSGTVGVGDTDVAGVGEADVLEASDIMETVPVKELATKTSPFAESYAWPPPPAVTLAIIVLVLSEMTETVMIVVYGFARPVALVL